MRFTLLLEGTLPSSGDATQKAAIRTALQHQLKELYKVTSSAVNLGNKIIIGNVEYIGIIPIDWTCRLVVRIVRRTAPVGRVGNSDLDNLMKTLSDGITAPNGHVGQAAGTAVTETTYCVALEDNQITSINVEEDYLWSQPEVKDLAVITVYTKETTIDDRVALGGSTFRSFRQNVY